MSALTRTSWPRTLTVGCSTHTPSRSRWTTARN
nr:MAG TPA: hypothetical protein [Caudoviricetes sp.]